MNKFMHQRYLWFVAAGLLLIGGVVGAQDWPQWGRNISRNMVAPGAKGLPIDFDPGRTQGRSDHIDMKTTRGIKWIAKLGSQTYGNPTVANGRIYIGTNNGSPRNAKFTNDRSMVYCLDEKTGKLIWQLNVPKLGAGKISDWEYLGICSSPAVEGDRVYVVTNLCEVICLDVSGLSDGNDGPFVDEGQHIAGKGRAAVELRVDDADIIWRYDMREELLVFPHNVTSSSVLIVGDQVWVTTSNGVDWSHKNIPAPQSPALVVLDKNTGKLIGEEASGISSRLMHSNWSSPAAGRVGDQLYIFYGAGDGYCYGFYPTPTKDDDGFDVLKEAWRFDCNLPGYRMRDGEPIAYATHDGPSEIIATPVFYNDRIYVAIGQDPEHGEGVGSLSCIDATGSGDISKSGLVWRYTGLDRAISTVSIADGLVYIADYAGVLHCLDADTGELYWTHDTLGHIWGSTLVADGKVYLGNEDGILTILEAGKKKKVLAEIEFNSPIHCSPIVANNVLYIATMTHLYAIEASK